MTWTAVEEFLKPFRDFLERVGLGQNLPPHSTVFIAAALAGLLGLVIVVAILRILFRGRAAANQNSKAIQTFLARGELIEAAQLYLVQGDLEKALPLFLQGRAFFRAGRVYEMMGDHLQAGEIYEKGEHFEEAVAAYKKAGKADRAGKVLSGMGRSAEAGKLYEEAGLLTHSANVFEENSQYEEAAKIYSRLEDYENAGNMLAHEHLQRVRAIRGAVRPEEWRYICKLATDAAETYLRGGFKEKAADFFLKGEDFARAAQILQELDDWESAVAAFRKGLMMEEAAQLLEKHGRTQEAHEARGEGFRRKNMLLEAAGEFAKAGDHGRAAELWADLDEPRRAADAFREAERFAEAAQIYVRIGDFKNAAFCFEKANIPEEAARFYGKIGQMVKQAELLIKANKYLAAGQIYMKEGALDKAISIFQAVPEGNEEYRQAGALLGKIFLDKGILGVALKKYQQALEGEKVNPKNIDHYYHLGIIHERQGSLQVAARIYEQILATHYDYGDVASRLGNLQLELSKVAGGAEKAASSSPELFDATVMTPGQKPGGASAKGKPDRFELVKEIGRGGMGIVYQAKDRILNRVVALKYLPSNFAKNALAVRNFEREAQSTASLNHPGIVTIFDVGYDSRGNYIAMEYLEGLTIKDYVRKHGKLKVHEVFGLFQQMAEALDYAHCNKVVHRDIKSSNMMWCKAGGIKLMDFGLAKFMQEAQNAATQISGTPYYMSPEQTLGKDLDHRTDIYSFGVSLYEAMTGVVPFKEGDIGYHQIHTPTPDPREKNPDIPEGLKTIVWKCMEKKPEARYQNAGELARDLAAAFGTWRHTQI